MEFFDVLVRYEVSLWDAVDRELDRRGLIGLAQLHALRLISGRDGRARVQDLTGDIGITVGAVSKLVDRLERDGLAERSPNPANRRSSLITLTAHGRECLLAASAVAQEVLGDAVDGEDLPALTATLRRLQARLDGLEVGAA